MQSRAVCAIRGHGGRWMSAIVGGRGSEWFAAPLAVVAALAASTVVICAVGSARADEAGVGFWLPGQFGSLAAVPQTPGWNLGIIDYYTSISAGGGEGCGSRSRGAQRDPPERL